MKRKPISEGGTSKSLDTISLSLLEVLDDEDRELHNESAVEMDPERDRYAKFRAELGDEHPETKTAEAAFRSKLYSRFHSRPRTALCFSGGGIRSATFGLGVLQGLSKYSKDVPEGGKSLLGEFDFLSTVSGGGYLGAWFSAWAARLEGVPPHRKSEEPSPKEACTDPRHPAVPRSGAVAVIAELDKPPTSCFEPEPDAVRHLRSYSNYLSPQLGLASGDTWALMATVARNILLNWMVLFPLLMAGLLVPMLAHRFLWLKPENVSPDLLRWFLGAGIGLAMVGTAYVGLDLPSTGNGRHGQRWYLIGCLLPLVLAGIALNTVWAWLPPGSPNASWWDFVGRGKYHLGLMHFLTLGAVVHGGGILAGIVLAMLVYRRPPPSRGLRTSLGALATGLLGGWFARMLASFAAFDCATGEVANTKLYVCFGFPLVLCLFLAVTTLLVGATSYITEDEDREWWSRSGGWLAATAIAWPIFAGLVLYAGDFFWMLGPKLASLSTAGTGMMGWAVSALGGSADTRAARSGESPTAVQRAKELLGYLLLPAFVISLAVLLSALDKGLVRIVANGVIERAIGIEPLPSFWPHPLAPIAEKTTDVLWVMVALLLACLIASWFINVNKFSLHAMYRARLIRAYLGASNSKRDPHPFTGFDENDNISMCNLSRYRPMHVVNMALNLVAGKNLAWQQRKAESFTSTRLHTGSCRIGYRPSKQYGGGYRSGKTPISLGTAITISGAAASPNMGYHSSPLLAIVMTLFNARLGWWLGNPRSAKNIWKLPGPKWGIRAFIDEALGRTDDNNSWVYLSDGGHFENLGLYEMVLRRCKVIVVSDASADPDYTYDDLGNAVRKIRVDLGISITLEESTMPCSPIQRRLSRVAKAHCATARIAYSAVDGDGAEDGLLIYIKPTLSGGEPADIRQYASGNSCFPQQPTSDQYFDESQFECYRRLGLYSVDEICAMAGPEAPSGGKLTLEEFKLAARRHAGLPGAAPVTVRDPDAILDSSTGAAGSARSK